MTSKRLKEGSRGQGVCDDSTEAFIIKRLTMGEGTMVNYCPKLLDVINGRPLNRFIPFLHLQAFASFLKLNQNPVVLELIL